jgi:2-polyprenyl-6-methoxyphenol hydroxylase-like FAD-dependent oxidoreductase
VTDLAPGLFGGRDDDPFLVVEVSRIDHPRYNFILALPQSRTEAVLLARLSELGVEVAWQTEFTGYEEDKAGVTATLKRADGAEEQVRAGALLGADGAHSAVRKAAGIGFIGERYPEVWHLADLPIDWDRPEHQINAFTDAGGRMLFSVAISAGRWRLIGNQPDYLAMLPKGAGPGEPYWTSEFHISRRLAARYSVGRVHLAGDAAHIHSPAGGRGMNLGMEDAWEFARLLDAGALERYNAMRHKVGRAVVKQTDRFIRVATLKNPVLRALLHLGGRTAARLPFAQRRALTNVAGLDPNRTMPE